MKRHYTPTTFKGAQSVRPRCSSPLLPSITNFNSINMNYTLVLWPESQTYMDEPWFDDHAILADYDSVGESQAYFIPTEYIKS